MDNDVLRQAPLFSALDDEAATALRASMSDTRLRRGDVLFHEGDSGDKLYIVLDGKVKLGRSSSDGRENLLAILGPASLSVASEPLRVDAPMPAPEWIDQVGDSTDGRGLWLESKGFLDDAAVYWVDTDRGYNHDVVFASTCVVG